MQAFQQKFIMNTASIRWLKLLNAFEEQTTLPIKELAILTDSSTRTIIRDISDIRNYFGHTITIESSQNGYHLIEMDPERYLELKRNIVLNEPLFVILENIFFQNLLEVSEWADKLNISDQSLITYLKKVDPIIKKFELKLTMRPINLIGTEVSIRKFFIAFYYESDITPHTIFPSINTQDAVIEITKLLNLSSHQTTSFAYTTYLLYMSIERFKQGNSVSISDSLKKIFDLNKIFFDTPPLNKILYKYFNTQITEDEALYLYIHLVSRRKILDIDSEINFCKNYNKWPEITTIANDYNQFIHPPSNFSEANLVLIESFFTSLKLRDSLSPIENQNLDNSNNFCKKIFNSEYAENFLFLSEHPLFKKLYSNKYLDDICCNLTLYMEGIRERLWGARRRIAFIFEGNHYLCEYLTNWTHQYLGRFHTLFFPDSNELSPSYLQSNSIDLLVTNYSEYLTEYLLNSDCLLFKSIPDANDWNKLLNHINPKITRNLLLQNNLDSH